MSDGLLPRASSNDDVIVAVRMRRSSFEKLTSELDGRAVPVGDGMIGLVPGEPDEPGHTPVWTFVVWSPNRMWHGVPEPVPGNGDAAEALSRAASG